MTDLQANAFVGFHFFLDNKELALPTLIDQALVDVLLHDALAQFFSDRAECFLGFANAIDADLGLAPCVARKGHRRDRWGDNR